MNESQDVYRELLTALGPAVIAAYLLIDRVFKFINTRNGRSPDANLKKLVEQNELLLKNTDKMLEELHHMRLDIARSCRFEKCTVVKEPQNG